MQASMRAMDWKMAPARGGTIESRGSMEVCQSAMETGEVEVKGTRELKGMTELTETQRETQDLEVITETQELHKEPQEHTHT